MLFVATLSKEMKQPVVQMELTTSQYIVGKIKTTTTTKQFSVDLMGQTLIYY